MADDDSHALTTCYRRRLLALTAFIAAFSGLAERNADAEPQLAVDISASNSHCCMVTSCGNVRCWGNNNDGQAADRILSDKLFIPYWEGLYDEVSTGYAHTCARQRATPPGQGGRVTCWGATTPAGNNHGCYIDGDSEVQCWGSQW